jgi:hypothetical protein
MIKQHGRAIVTAIPLILVNIVAISGQYAFLRDHLSWPVIGTVIFAAAIESTALFLAYMAHQSLMCQDSSLRLRLGALGFGILAGLMNYSHYAVNGKATFVAIATAIMSASSPVLWGIYSRRQSRDALMTLGLIEPGAVRLGINRWVMYPARSFRVYRAAAWLGVREPAEAIALIETGHAALKSPPVIPTLTDMATKADAVRYAVRAIAAESTDTAGESNLSAADAQTIAAWLRARAGALASPAWEIPAGYVRDVLRRDAESAAKQRRSTVRAIGAQDSGHAAAGT